MGSEVLSPGEEVWPMRAVATIPDLSQMRVALELSQEQARQVKPKQKARVLVETAPGKVFSAEVTDISHNAEEQRGTWDIATGERIFHTSVLIKNTQGAFLRPGTTSQATIIVQHLPKVLALPLECIFDRDGKKIVYVRRGEGFGRWRCNWGPATRTAW